ncbi:hypothetical protein Q4Q34_06065 [Flavivirga abyssicola]|uniref:hypothetical protein n=1 Tax=Flavivirga abyssicola TaxID=3063533 RepID=UPI0026E08392|nr:hypothetical protein [Flavivirga sp. MEBiC07777]WVK14593.1 hypothetical protein Q4Q34_06065 [Flavivirga sp. MEBiC07777]
MDLKSAINFQRFFLLIFFAIILEIAVGSYLPWLKAVYNEGFVLIKGSKLYVNDDSFYNTFFIKTLRFLGLILLIIPLFNYNKFLISIKTKSFFEKKNSQLLIKSSTLLLLYAFLNYVLNYLDVERHYFNMGYIVFIGFTCYTFGIIFKRAYKNKQENDLTI